LLRDGEDARALALAEEILRTPRQGRVWLVGAGPGGPDLLTLAAREALAHADVVLHDALIEPSVLAPARQGARLGDGGERGGRRFPQERINALLRAAAGAGDEVVRLKGGDPFVFARGGEEAAFLAEAGIEVRVIPGVSSATAAPALAGIPLTLRGVASSVAFVTARGAGAQRADLRRLAVDVDTLVVLMARDGLPEVAGCLAEVLGDARPAAVVAAAGTGRQQVVRGDLASIAQRCAAAEVAAPATLVVGEVVAGAAASQRRAAAV